MPDRITMVRVAMLGLVVCLPLAACGGSGASPSKGCTNLSSLSLAAPAGDTSATAGASISRVSAARPAPVTAGGTVVKIGLAAPLSGTQAQVGRDIANGALLAIDEANARGVKGPNGEALTLQLVTGDDQHDNTVAATVAHKLVAAGVVAVVGHQTSGDTLVAEPIYHDAGIAQITPSATNADITNKGYKNVFRAIGQDNAEAVADADLITRLMGCTNVAVIDDQTPYGKQLADGVSDALGKRGGSVVAREFNNNRATSFLDQVNRIKAKNPGPDAVFFSGTYVQAGFLAAQMKTRNLNVPLVGADGLHAVEFFRSAGAAGDRTYLTDFGADSALSRDFPAFQARYQARFKTDVVQFAPQAYDATNIIIDAIRRAGTDRAAIITAISQTNNYRGVVQDYAFDSHGDLKHPVFTVYKSVKNDWKPLQTIAT